MRDVEREIEREIDRQTERERKRERDLCESKDFFWGRGVYWEIWGFRIRESKSERDRYINGQIDR